MGGGGAERQVVEILKRVDRSRFEPFLYLTCKEGQLLGEVPGDVPIFAYWDGKPEPWSRKILGRLKLNRFLRPIHLARILHQQRIDLIYDRTYLATLEAASGCWLRPTPRISCCVADSQPELELHARWSVRLAWWFARRAYQSASIVLANSEGLRRRVIDYFRLPEHHVKVFYSLLADVRNAEPDSMRSEAEVYKRLAEFDSRLDLATAKIRNSESETVGSSRQNDTDSIASTLETDEPFLIVSAGRLHPQKGYRFLLEAADELIHRRHRMLKVVIFGVGESEHELRDLIRNHKLESHVVLAGFVRDPRHWYSQADLFVLPSLCEGMPNSLIEAVAWGIPVLATDCFNGPREILNNGECGELVAPGDSQALADGIINAMDHRDKWKSRVDLAKRRVEQMFDPETGIRRLESLFEQIAGR
jgi:glycosyltransferase involved in cell wall biosynthesis